MEIKKVLQEDLKRIFNLEFKIFKKNAFSKDLIKNLIKKNQLFLKIEKRIGIKKVLIGFVIVVKDRKDRVNIINFLINPKHQNKGYGTILLRKTINIIKSLKEIKKIVLNVQINNSFAIKLYNKFGFTNIQKIDNYYQTKESAYLMELNIVDLNNLNF